MAKPCPLPRRRVLATAAVFSALVAVLAPAAVAADGPIFVLTDPAKDDYGDGHLRYPIRTRNDMVPGSLDLLSFAAYREKGGTAFEATFARPVVKPEPVPVNDTGTLMTDVLKLGFYTFNIDVYVDTDGKPGSGNTQTLPGRNAEIDPAHAWERAICLTPMPGPAETVLRRGFSSRLRKEAVAQHTGGGRLPDGAKAEIREEVTRQLEESVFFPTRVTVRGLSIRFFVPDLFLGGPAKAEWGYVVAVSGADIEGRFDVGKLVGVKKDDEAAPLFIMRAAPGRGENAFGGADEDAPAPCPLIDILVPPGTTQEKVLADYDTRRGRPVRLPAVVPADLSKAGAKK